MKKYSWKYFEAKLEWHLRKRFTTPKVTSQTKGAREGSRGRGNVTGRVEGSKRNGLRCNLWGCETAPHRGQVLIAHNSTVNLKTKMHRLHTANFCSPCMPTLNDEPMIIVYNSQIMIYQLIYTHSLCTIRTHSLTHSLQRLHTRIMIYNTQYPLTLHNS